MTKSELRKARRQAHAAGRDWSAIQEGGRLSIIEPRTPRAERRHARAMWRWAARYEQLNGAPEGPEDR